MSSAPVPSSLINFFKKIHAFVLVVDCLFSTRDNLGAISLKLLGGQFAPKLVYCVLRKELLKLE